MAELYEILERPALEAPVLVLALDGWIDAGMAAAHARQSLLATLATETVAVFDSDTLLDHRARRPTMSLVDGEITDFIWPMTELRATSDADGNDLLLLIGSEPDHRWPSFVKAVGGLAVEFGTRLAVGLGAYPAAVPHTRASRLAIAASSGELTRSESFILASIDAPAGVQAAIERQLAAAGVPAAGLWAQVPHYASALPYPAASAALVDGLAALGSLELDSDRLHHEATEMRHRLDALIGGNAEHLAMVRQLEEQWDESDAGGPSPLDASALPSGDELAAEVERYLREQGRP